jgi:hypothetical protein
MGEGNTAIKGIGAGLAAVALCFKACVRHADNFAGAARHADEVVMVGDDVVRSAARHGDEAAASADDMARALRGSQRGANSGARSAAVAAHAADDAALHADNLRHAGDGADAAADAARSGINIDIHVDIDIVDLADAVSTGMDVIEMAAEVDWFAAEAEHERLRRRPLAHPPVPEQPARPRLVSALADSRLDVGRRFGGPVAGADLAALGSVNRTVTSAGGKRLRGDQDCREQLMAMLRGGHSPLVLCGFRGDGKARGMLVLPDGTQMSLVDLQEAACKAGVRCVVLSQRDADVSRASALSEIGRLAAAAHVASERAKVSDSMLVAALRVVMLQEEMAAISLAATATFDGRSELFVSTTAED